jgi:3-oxoacyl-[acyl-carrier protein] reductase
MPLLEEPFSLAGRSAVVTGAARGIGRGIALVLASAGARVWVTDVDEASTTATVEQIRSHGWAAESAALDVSAAEDATRVADLVAGAASSLDIWVNNAGIIGDAPPSQVSDEELLRVWKVNFLGVSHGSQAAARHMVSQGRGVIVNITTGGVDKPMDTVSAYTSSKAAAHQYTRSLALELAPRGVRVNAVAAGWVETGITRRHHGGDEVERERTLQATVDRTPLGFIGDEFDQAYAVLYLASDAARFITGTVLRPNGGTSMPW